MENYEEKYRQVLKKAERIKRTYCKSTQIYKEVMNMFPELAESEDEKIRKELLGFIENWKNPNNLGRLQDYPMFTKNEEQCNKYIAWLEKQGEQKSTDKIEPKFHEGEWITIKE